MHELKGESYTTYPLYQYIDWGNVKKTSLSELCSIDRKRTLKRFLLEYALDVDWNFWEKSDIRKMSKDELCDLVEEDMDANELDLNERRDYAEKYGLFIEADNFKFYITSGYSQGEYAQWCIHNSDLKEFKDGCELLKSYVDHLFWDSIVTYRLIVNDTEYYIDEYVKDEYKYDENETYNICKKLFKDHEKKDYILSFIAENLPEYLEYN